MIYRCVALYSLFSLLVKSCTFLVTCHILKNFLHIFGGHKILWVHLHYFNNQYLCSHSSGKFYAQVHRIHFMFNPTLIQQDFMVSSSLIPSPKEEKGLISAVRAYVNIMRISLLLILRLCYYQVANCSGTACLCKFCTITDSRRPTCLLNIGV